MSKYYIAEFTSVKARTDLFRLVGPYDTYEEAKQDIENSNAFVVKKCVEENQYGAPVKAYPWEDLDSVVDEEER